MRVLSGAQGRRRRIQMQRVVLEGAGGLSLVGDLAGPSEGPGVLLTHGAGQTRAAWKRAVALLAQAGFHVLALDLRGHGESAWASGSDYALQYFVDDIRAVASTFPQPPALVGASLGGVASLVAVGEGGPGIASALVLVDVAPRIDPGGADQIRAFMAAAPDGFASVEEAADAVALYMPHRPRPRDPSGLMKNLRPLPSGRLRWHWDPRIVTDDQESPLKARPRLESAAARVSVPTLLLRGALSEIVTDEAVENFMGLLPTAEYVRVEGAGHMVAGDRNDAFSLAIVDFLTRHLMTPRGA